MKEQNDSPILRNHKVPGTKKILLFFFKFKNPLNLNVETGHLYTTDVNEMFNYHPQQNSNNNNSKIGNSEGDFVDRVKVNEIEATKQKSYNKNFEGSSTNDNKELHNPFNIIL